MLSRRNIYFLRMDKWFPIHTMRLVLREFTTADESDVHEYASDVVVARYMDWGPNTPAQPHHRIGGYVLRAAFTTLQ